MRAHRDGFQGQVLRTGPARDWCLKCKIQQTKMFPVKEVGVEASQILAEAWCDKMQWFYDAYCEGLMDRPDTAAQVFDSYVEPEEFRHLMNAGDAKVQAFGNGIRGLFAR